MYGVPFNVYLPVSPEFFQHDCDNNVELFREGRYITFRVIKSIGVGEEVTAHYGDDYCT